MPTKIQVRRDSYLNFGNAQVTAGATPLLSAGELAWDSGQILKIGDGSSIYQRLPSIQPTHFSVLTSSLAWTGITSTSIFGSSLNLYQSTVYEIEYQIIGSFTISATGVNVSIGNTFAGTATAGSRFIVEWTCHKDQTGTEFDGLSGFGAISSDTGTPTYKDVSSDWNDTFKINRNYNNTTVSTGTYYFAYKVKGVLVNAADGGVNTFTPKLVISDTTKISSASIGAGSYIKVTQLGQKATVTRSGDWNPVSGGTGGGGYPLMT